MAQKCNETYTAITNYGRDCCLLTKKRYDLLEREESRSAFSKVTVYVYILYTHTFFKMEL